MTVFTTNRQAWRSGRLVAYLLLLTCCLLPLDVWAAAAEQLAVDLLRYAEKTTDASRTADAARLFAALYPEPEAQVLKNSAERLRDGSWTGLLARLSAGVREFGCEVTYLAADRPEPNCDDFIREFRRLQPNLPREKALAGLRRLQLLFPESNVFADACREELRVVVRGVTQGNLKATINMLKNLQAAFPEYPDFGTLATQFQELMVNEQNRENVLAQADALLRDAKHELADFDQQHVPKNLYEERQQFILLKSEKERLAQERENLDDKLAERRARQKQAAAIPTLETELSRVMKTYLGAK